MERKLVGMIVPDVHENFERLIKILAKYPTLWAVFLGDWFDTFANHGAPTINTMLVAKWLRDNITNPLYTFLWGNHDLHYAFPLNDLCCSGWNRNKLEIIRNHIGDTDDGWKKFKLHKWIEFPNIEFLLTHAGLHPYLLHPIHGFGKNWLNEMTEETMYKVRYEKQVTSALTIGPGRESSSRARVGGIVWLDWKTEFMPIEGLNQIVGHTPGDHVRTKMLRNDEGVIVSANYCLDTHLKHVILVFDDGTLQIESI